MPLLRRGDDCHNAFSKTTGVPRRYNRKVDILLGVGGN